MDNLEEVCSLCNIMTPEEPQEYPWICDKCKEAIFARDEKDKHKK